MIKGINHLGIATRNLNEISELYTTILPDASCHHGEVAGQGVRVSCFQVGESDIEFLEPTGPDSPISKFLDKSGTGIHHIALTTDNIEEELKRFREKGFRLIDENPRIGMGGKKIAFLHPKSTGGILLELCEG